MAAWQTGQVLDMEVLSKWCSECHEKSKECSDAPSTAFLDWWEEQQAFCRQNHYGLFGSMEMEGVMKIWQQSVEKQKLRYMAMIADGDSSTFP